MVFDSNIEEKIIEFVKKSPIGVTSSEIASYLNINRITLAKYLSVIKERTLIDFKQLGMAKLWYIPVNITKEMVLKTIITNLLLKIDKEESKKLINETGLQIGKDIEKIYKEFYGVGKLNIDQIVEAFTDAQNKIGGSYIVIEKSADKVIFKGNKTAFGDMLSKVPSLSSITSHILGMLVARNFGYSKVSFKKSIAKGDNEDLIVVYLKKTKESEEEKADEYHPTE
ncbi:hypothetical protein J4209_03655 [Candidatus Woesearchaeota archaeon]|nr:hypothetical protein [Candidatus Woesearchaeota archaeon]